jgi:hypothetical protein
MSAIKLSTPSSGSISLSPANTASNLTITVPAVTGTMATSVTPTFTTTIGVGGATPAATGAGITFPATKSPSSDANTLDDYEEGTFTPTFAFSGGSTGVAYSEQSGRYTKIGRQVTVECELILSSKGSSTGRVQIGGLPFTSISNEFTGSVELRSVTFSQKYAIVEVGRASGLYFRVMLIDSNASSAELFDTGVSNTSGFLFSATYFV